MWDSSFRNSTIQLFKVKWPEAARISSFETENPIRHGKQAWSLGWVPHFRWNVPLPSGFLKAPMRNCRSWPVHGWCTGQLLQFLIGALHKTVPMPTLRSLTKEVRASGQHKSNPGEMTCLTSVRSCESPRTTSPSKVLVSPCNSRGCFVGPRVLCLASQADVQPHIRMLHTRAFVCRW